MRETMYSCLHSSKVEMLRVSPIVQESRLQMGQSSTSYFVSRNPKLFYIEVQLLEDTHDQVYWLRTYVTSTKNTSDVNVKMNSYSLININLNYLSVECSQFQCCRSSSWSGRTTESAPLAEQTTIQLGTLCILENQIIYSCCSGSLLYSGYNFGEHLLSCKPRVIKNVL